MNDAPLEDLADWIRAEHSVGNHDVGEPMTDERMDALTDRAVAEGARRQVRARHRRRRRLAAGIGVAVALSTGGAVAAALFWQEEPTRPQAGTVCRSTADVDADAIVTEVSADPVGVCRNLWDDGEFVELGVIERPAELAACVSENGTVDVFPGTNDVCADLGLAVADTDLGPDGATMVELETRLVDEINMIDCLSATEAEAVARQVLEDLELGDWQIEVNADARGAACAKASVGGGRLVVIFKY